MSFWNKFKIVISSIFVKFFTFLVARDEGIWVFGSWFGERYSDNPRYLFEFLSQNKLKFGVNKLIWVTHSDSVYSLLIERGTEVHKINSFLGVYYHLRAKFFVYDQSIKDLNTLLARGAVKVNLYHGVPLKKIGYHYKARPKEGEVEKFLRNVLRFNKDKSTSFILAPSDFSANIYKTAFNQEVIRGPYPRNMFLCGKIESLSTNLELQYIKDIKSNGKKIIFYLPTFRDNCDLKFFGESNASKNSQTISRLSKMGYQVVTKLHFADTSTLNHEKLQNLINLPSELDIYPILKITDILITDYSSVSFDFLYLDKEIVYFPYDLDYYKRNDRGLILDYEIHTSGCKVTDANELLDAISKIKHNKIDYSQERKELRMKIFDDLSIEDFINDLKTRA